MRRRAKKTGISQGKRGGGIVSALPGVVRSIARGLLRLGIFVTVVAGVSISFLSLYHYLLTSPYMNMEEVKIEGVERKIRNELVQMAGLDRERNLLALNLERLKKRMEEHPWVRTVRIERRLPHTLLIEVERQVPAALVLTDRFYYMNRHGEIFKRVSPGDDNDFPIVTGLSRDELRAGVQLKRVAHVIAVLQTQRPPWSMGEVSEIHLRKDREISLYFDHLRAEVRFIWNELDEKIDGLKKVAEHLNRSGKINMATRINLNYEDGAVVSFKRS